MHQLLAVWRAYDPKAPFVLQGDEYLLEAPKLTTRCAGWNAYAFDPDFGQPSGSSLHLDLLPMPFAGNLEKAKVYLLMLNPGLAPTDYYGEYNVPAYRAELLRNLKQVEQSSFIFLDPAYSWHGGYLYWHAKLAKLISSVAREFGVRYGEARRLIQENIAVIELLPYHSATFAVPNRALQKLQSVELARNFVHEVLVPNARSGECLIVATRAKSQWKLPENERNIICYSGSEARAAHLSANSRGGKAIASFIRRAASAA
jgi:hypothetical protein